MIPTHNMQRGPFPVSDSNQFHNTNGQGFFQPPALIQNHVSNNQQQCQIGQSRPHRPNLIWNFNPDNNPFPNNGPNWRQNRPCLQYQNNSRPCFQNGPRMQIRQRMPFTRCPNSFERNVRHTFVDQRRWQNGNGNCNQNEGLNNNITRGSSDNNCHRQNGFQNMNQGNCQNRWGNRNKMNNHMKRPTGNWKQNSNNKSKNKVNKRDLAENNKYYCDACDRGFKTEEKYQGHINEHEKCKVDGCTYVAAPKLVQLHYRFQHSTGVAKKIWRLDSKEEIEKWRNERKRNYPTAENIAKKKKLLEDKKFRGEVIEKKEFGKFKKRKFNNAEQIDLGKDTEIDQKRRRKRNNRRNHQNNYTENRDKSDINDACTSPTKKLKQENSDGLSSEVKCSDNSCSESIDGNVVGTASDSIKNPALDPLSYVLDGNSSDGSSEDKDVSKGNSSLISTSQGVDNSVVQIGGGLGCIQSMYASDSESENEIKTEVETSEHTQITVKEMKEEDRTKTSPYKSRPKRKKKTSLFNRKSMTLLEKLLANEIRQERNKILQCVHYIVKNNFYGVGKQKANKGIQIQNGDKEVTTDTQEKSVNEIKTAQFKINDDVWNK